MMGSGGFEASAAVAEASLSRRKAVVGSGGVAVELAAGPRCSGEATSREDLGRAGGLHRAGARGRGRQRRRAGIAGGRRVPRRWRPEAGCSPAGPRGGRRRRMRGIRRRPAWPTVEGPSGEGGRGAGRGRPTAARIGVGWMTSASGLRRLEEEDDPCGAGPHEAHARPVTPNLSLADAGVFRASEGAATPPLALAGDGSRRTGFHSVTPSFLPHREAPSSLTSGAVEEEEVGWARRRCGSLDGDADTVSGARHG